MPGMPMHLVQELNVGTVGFKYFSISFLNISLSNFYWVGEVGLWGRLWWGCLVDSGSNFSMILVLRSERRPGGGGALRYRGGPHLCYVFRGRRGLFLRPPHVRDFVKEGYFFVPRYEVWGSKSPYNPRNIRGSDAAWLPKWLRASEFASATCCR